MPRFFNRTSNLIVDLPGLTFICLVLISAFAVWGYYSPESFRSLFDSKDETATAADPETESYGTPPNVDPVSITDSHAIILVESDSYFTPAGAQAMRHVVAELESLDHVSNILWMDRVPLMNIFGLPEPLLPQSTATKNRFEAAKQKALDHPLVVGQLLSADARHLILLVNFEFLFIESDEDCTTGLRKAAEAAAATFPEVDLKFRVTGRVPMYITHVKTREGNLLKYQIIGYGMIAVMAVILFRGINAVIIVAIAPALGVFWTMGILRFLDWQDNPFNDVVVPVMLSLVGLTDGVHLMVQIRKRRAAGLSPKEAARTGIHEVGLACFLTSVTTAIGFGSLSLSHNEVVQKFGWSCVLGVNLTFFAVITSIPLACSTWLGKRVHVGHEKGMIDRHLGRIGGLVEFVLNRTRTMSYLGIGATVMLVLICSSLRPDERLSNNLPARSEAVVAMQEMDQAFGGLEFGTVRLVWKGNVESDAPDILHVLREVDTLLRTEPLIGHPLSICNLLDALPGDGQDGDRMSMLELLPPPLKRAFYTPEHRRAEVNFRVQDIGIAKYGPVFERIQSGLAEISQRYPDFTLQLTGRPIWRWENLYQIVVDLAASLGTATVIIFLVLSLVYKSLRIGLISLIPNIFPLAVTGTYLVITGQMLEIVSVCAFTVCLGIAVDDTIHFVTRFLEEEQVNDNPHDSIRKAFTTVGTALIMTTIVLIAGFSTVILSDARDYRIFAAMSGLTIGSALFADLVFLPALLARFAKKKTPIVGQP